MSTEIAIIPRTGVDEVPLQVTEFCGPAKKGMMLQLTQGIGDQYCPGYIELTECDAWRLLSHLEGWLLDSKEVKDDSLSAT